SSISAAFTLTKAPKAGSWLKLCRCIGALNRRKFFCDKALRRSRGVPRCRRSVTRNCLNLHLSRGAMLLRPLMVGRSRRTLVVAAGRGGSRDPAHRAFRIVLHRRADGGT